MVGLLEKGMYNPLGKVISFEFLKREPAYYSYLFRFETDKLLVNLGVNGKNEISYLMVLPYTAEPAFKRSSYLKDNPLQSPLDSLIDKTVSSYMMNPNNSGLSIAVSANGKNYFYNYGEPVRDSKTLCTAKTVYEIGSVTKTFCGTLLALAVVEGKIRMDDDIRKHLPGNYPKLHYKNKPILVKHLVSHTSGLVSVPQNITEQREYNEKDPYKNYSKKMMLAYLAETIPASEPGMGFEYSNYGMALLGLILEEVYGKNFEALVIEKIYSSLNLVTAANNTVENALAQGYNDEGAATPHWNLGDFSAAGCLRLSSSDLQKYVNYHLEAADEAVKLSHQSVFKNERENVGMAWFIKKTKFGNTLFWHNGGTFGFSSFCGFVPEKKFSMVILSNSSGSVDYIGIALSNFLQK